MTLLSLDIFKYFTFDYKFIKPSKILIWAIGKFYRSNFTRPKTKDRTFYRSNFRPKDKPLPFWIFWWFLAQTCFLPHFWVWLFQNIKNIDFWPIGKFYRSTKTRPYNCLCLCLCLCMMLWWCAENIIFDILAPSAFRKYATCTVFSLLCLCRCLYLCLCIWLCLFPALPGQVNHVLVPRVSSMGSGVWCLVATTC